METSMLNNLCFKGQNLVIFKRVFSITADILVLVSGKVFVCKIIVRFMEPSIQP